MTNKRLAEIRKKAYNQALEFDGTVAIPPEMVTAFQLYDSLKAIEEFNAIGEKMAANPTGHYDQNAPFVTITGNKIHRGKFYTTIYGETFVMREWKRRLLLSKSPPVGKRIEIPIEWRRSDSNPIIFFFHKSSFSV